MIDTNTG